MFNMILNSSAFVWIFCTGWLLLPLLVGLWHWSHVGADRSHVCHRLLGDQHYFHHYQYHNGFWLSPDFTYFGEALTVPLFSVVLEIVGVEYLFSVPLIMDHCHDLTGDYHDRSSRSGLKHVAISTPGSRKATPGKENQPRPTCVRQVFTEDTLGCGTVDFGKYSHIPSITRETNVCKGRIPNLRRWKNFEKNLQYSFQKLGLERWCQPNFEELKKIIAKFICIGQ